MPRKTGIDLLDAMAAEHLTGKTVVLTAAISQEEVVEVIKRGASGLVLKESSPDELVECVRKVYAGEQWIDQDTVTRALQGVHERQSVRHEAVKGLTPRELEIVRMVAQGLRNRAIGERLAISEGTVKVHLHNIYEKMGVEGRLELVLVAQQKGLV
jgi:DNA-binding NarL/FixJ family response regulator